MTSYAIYAKVTKVEWLKDAFNGWGWFVHFEGSWESICLSRDRDSPPEFAKGDTAKITFTKQERATADDLPSQPPVE